MAGSLPARLQERAHPQVASSLMLLQIANVEHQKSKALALVSFCFKSGAQLLHGFTIDDDPKTTVGGPSIGFCSIKSYIAARVLLKRSR
jgi:hypothetical protein